MIAFEDIQGTVATQLAGHSYLSGLTIIEDDGLQSNAIEDALGDDGDGVAIFVSFPTEGQPVDTVTNLSAEDCSIAVAIRVNPQRNSETTAGRPGAQKSLPLLLKAVREAVLSWETENRDRLGFRSGGFSFPFEVEGEIGYVAFFNVRAAFQRPA